jgi:enamine deaminase RidA (YjgF/YER057c/UK114 family)
MKNYPTVPGLSTPRGYSYVVSATGKMVFVAGQIALDKDGNVVGNGDLRAQTTRVFENVKACLAAAGATFADVVKLNSYVVNLKAEDLPIIREVRSGYLPAANSPASTMVGVTALAIEGLLIEIEAVAVID